VTLQELALAILEALAQAHLGGVRAKGRAFRANGKVFGIRRSRTEGFPGRLETIGRLTTALRKRTENVLGPGRRRPD